jgi:hypothetical protein
MVSPCHNSMLLGVRRKTWEVYCVCEAPSWKRMGFNPADFFKEERITRKGTPLRKHTIPSGIVHSPEHSRGGTCAFHTAGFLRMGHAVHAGR